MHYALRSTVMSKDTNAWFASKGHEIGQGGDSIMSEITNSTELTTRDNVIVSNAPVSGNLYECGPLFVDEFSILLCASGSLIQAISSNTGELIGNFCGHSSAVTCIKNCPVAPLDNEFDNKLQNIPKSSTLVVSTSIDGCIIVWNKKTFKEVSRIQVAFSLYEIIVPATSKCPLFFGEMIEENRVQESVEGSSAEYSNPDANNDNDGIYIVIGLQPIVKSTNIYQDQAVIAAEQKKAKNKQKFVPSDPQTLVLYKIRQQQIKRRIAVVPGRQCAVSLGCLIADVYLAAATLDPTLNFFSESSNQAPIIRLNAGPASCITTVENSGKLVTGHENGEITIFHDLSSFLQNNNRCKRKNKAMSPPPSTTLHWHAHAVYSMALSPDANYLYSGADEAVLVVWQLGTGIKNFVPRLGGAITFISSSAKEAKVAITTADNAVRIVNTASMREVWELRAMYIPRVEVTKYDTNNEDKSSRVELVEAEGFFQSDIKYRCNIRIEGRSGNVACNGYPGQIQMFDLATQTFKTSHEIVQFQRVMRKEAHARMCAPSTMHFNFLDTPYGSLMVTVDVRKGEEADPEASLKFWEWDAFRSKYRLSVQVDRPHGSWKVTAAVFSPCATQTTRSAQQDVKAVAPGACKSSQILTCSCATAAIDGSVKIWLGQSQQAAASEDAKLSGVAAIGMQWTCSFSYKHRDCPTGALAFSFDGSLLAATYQNVVTLWDPAQVFLLKTVVIPSRNNVTFAAFIEPRASAAKGGGTGEAMLVVGSKRCLSVYDLISMKLIWCVEGYFSGFAVAPDESAAIRCYSSSSKNNLKCNGLAWIAAAVKRGPDEKRTSDPPNKIVLYGCYSPERLSVHPSRPRLTSMTFWSNQKDLTSSLSSGLVAITAHGEMLIVGPSEGLKQHCSDRSLTLSSAPQAKVSVVKVPPIPFSAVVHSYNQSSSSNDASSAAATTSSSLLSQSVIQQQGSIAISKNWLGELFDAKSGSIPPLSSIYNDFVGGLVTKQQPSSKTNEQPFSAADLVPSSRLTQASAISAAVSSGVGNKVRISEHLGRGNMGRNATFSDQRQEAFTGSISAFFHEFLQVEAAATHPAGADLGPASPTASRAAASAPVMTPTAKSASKSRKSEKRKSDAM